jgi:hypothetical protein
MNEVNSQGHSVMNGLFSLESKFRDIISRCISLKEENESGEFCDINDTARIMILNKELEKINGKNHK